MPSDVDSSETHEPEETRNPGWLRFSLLLLGPGVALLMLSLPEPAGMPLAGWKVAAVGVWMAIWWATEVLPIEVTALLPIILFPVLKIAPIKAVTASYADPIIFLFLGGLIVAKAIERCGLHKRIALRILRLTGTRSRRIVGGFMAAAAVLSMWISNTSTAMMLLPIGLSIVKVVGSALPNMEKQEKENFQMAMLLGIAYGATIGGIGTLVGTPPNALLAAFMASRYHIEVGFAQWMLVGVPLSLLMLPISWLVLVRWLFPLNFNAGPSAGEKIQALYQELGPLSVKEKRVAMIFLLLALAWMSRPLLEKVVGVDGLSDAGLAMMAALALFLVHDGAAKQGGGRNSPLMTWRSAAQIPWGILLLFGGGLSLAASVSQSGLAEWLGQSLAPLGRLGVWVLVIAAVLIVIFLTELTSNAATTATFLPVVSSIAVESGINPLLLAIPVTLAASFAFMLPVATPPNAVVFSSGLLTVRQMARAGLVLNLVGVILVCATALLLAPFVFR